MEQHVGSTRIEPRSAIVDTFSIVGVTTKGNKCWANSVEVYIPTPRSQRNVIELKKPAIAMNERPELDVI